MAQAMREVLSQRLQEHFVGRRKELDQLLGCLTNEAPLVTHVHGATGMGKTTLLRRFALEVQRSGGTVVSLDCGDIEPTERGFLAELERVLGCSSLELEDVAARLGVKGDPVVLILDDYQHVFLADTWVRRELLPALPPQARLVIGSREHPLPGWLIAPELQGLFLAIRVGPLSEYDALEMVSRAGLDADQARRINRLAQGHPLAIRLAIAAVKDGGSSIEEAGFVGIVGGLADLHLSEIEDSELREALEAGSVLRRVTIPLLAALLPSVDAAGIYERLRRLPYVKAAHDGLVIHAAVQGALIGSLRAANPERYRLYRERAWRALRSQPRSFGVSEMWRCTADMIYILDNAYIREAFFPNTLEPLSAEPATADDGAAISAIAAKHEAPAARALIEYYRSISPEAFAVLRDVTGQVKGFYIVLEPGQTNSSALQEDPLVRAWQRHLREHPVGKDETVIYLRRWLSEGEGELPSEVQGRCWLNVKQSYMALRPRLRRCYISVCDLETYGPVASSLGFQLVEGASIDLDGIVHHLAVLDMGPGSVDGWLAAHVARELGLDEAGILDLRSRELVLDGRRSHLTPLEFEFMRFLIAHQGEAVSRAALVEAVWGYEFDSESNVVDTLVASLRRKLKDRAGIIQTVWSVGYRLDV